MPKGKPQNRNGTGKKTLPKAAEPYKFKPGVSGNPGGRPRDVAGEISRAAIEQNAGAIYKAVVKRLISGDPKTFTAIADRGYGKSPQPISGDPNRPLEINVRIHRVGAKS